MSLTHQSRLQVAVGARNETIDSLLKQLEQTMAEKASIDAALQIDIAARKRCSEKIAELMTALRIILKYRAGLDGHYEKVVEEMERVTRSIRQLRLRRVDKRQQTITTSISNLTFYLLILILLVYVYRQAD